MKEGNNLDSSILIPLKLEEGGTREELPAFGRKHARNVHKLVVVDALSAILGQRDVLLQQIPQLFQILLVKHLRCLVLKEASARFLAYTEVQRVFIIRLLVEELGYVLESRVLLFFDLLFFL